MTAIGRLSAIFLLLLGIPASLHADLLIVNDAPAPVMSANRQRMFLDTTLTLDSNGEPTGWMLAPTPYGISYCGSEESVNCLTSADLVSKLTIYPSDVDDDNGPIRNNLPEPATVVLFACGAPLLVRRLLKAIG